MNKYAGWMVLALGSVALGQTAVTVTPASISEKRSATFIKKDNFFSSDVDGLTLKLHLEGPSLAGATKYGEIKIDSAKDDLGTALKIQTSGFHSADKFTDISHFDRSEAAATPGFDFPIELTLPPRKATTLVEVKGSLQALAGGEEKVVTVTKLSSMVGKTIDDPVLKSAGMTATIVKVDPRRHQLDVDYGGSFDALQQVQVLNAAGKSISAGQTTMSHANKRSTSYGLNGLIDDSATLEIHLMTGQRPITVPFDLKNVKLP